MVDNSQILTWIKCGVPECPSARVAPGRSNVAKHVNLLLTDPRLDLTSANVPRMLLTAAPFGKMTNMWVVRAPLDTTEWTL